MDMHAKRWTIVSWPLLVMAVVVGCASTPTTKENAQPTDQRVYFPPPPDPPRLQFLASFNRGDAWSKQQRQKTSLSKWIIGEEQKAGSQPTSIDTPYGIDAYKGRFYICDVGLNAIHVVDAAAGSYKRLGAPDGFKNPVNLTIDRRNDTKYVCDSEARMVLVFDANDNFVRQFGDPQKLMPLDLAIGNDELYIADLLDAEVEVWSMSGQYVRSISRKGPGPDELEEPTNLAVGPDGRIFVTDTLGQQVKVFDRGGNFLGAIGTPGDQVGSFARPKGIAIDPQGHIYVVDAQHGVVQIFNADGQVLLVISGQGGNAPGLMLPAGVAIDNTSLDAFKRYIAPSFQAEYLVFLVNQYGENKVAVYAFGRSSNVSSDAYEVGANKPTEASPPPAP